MGGDLEIAQLSRKERRSRKKKKKWLKRLIIALVLLLLLSGGFVGGSYYYANYRFNQIVKVHIAHLTPTTADVGGPFNVLLIGSDSRAFVSTPGQAQAFGSPNQYGGQRADVIIIARIDPQTHQISMLSIPRDTLVPIAGTNGNDKINAAYNNGPDQLVQSIQQDFGIPINHYIQINFEGLSNMVNALGGLQLNFPMKVKDNYSGLNITQTGCQTINGDQALALVRSRHLYYETSNGQWLYDGMSDWSRIRRQHAFFKAVITQAEGNLTDPLALNSFIGSAVKNLQIDDTFSASKIFSLAEEFHSFPYNALQTLVLPTTSYGSSSTYLRPAQPYASQVISDFMNLTVPSAPTTSSGSTSSSVPSSSTLLPSTTTTIPLATGETAPANQVVLDTPQSIPEPWNPVPC